MEGGVQLIDYGYGHTASVRQPGQRCRDIDIAGGSAVYLCAIARGRIRLERTNLFPSLFFILYPRQIVVVKKKGKSVSPEKVKEGIFRFD